MPTQYEEAIINKMVELGAKTAEEMTEAYDHKPELIRTEYQNKILNGEFKPWTADDPTFDDHWNEPEYYNPIPKLSSLHVRRLLNTISTWTLDYGNYMPHPFQDALDEYKSSSIHQYPFYPKAWDAYLYYKLLPLPTDRKVLLNTASTAILGVKRKIDRYEVPSPKHRAFYYDDDGSKVNVEIEQHEHSIQLLGKIPYGKQVHIVFSNAVINDDVWSITLGNKDGKEALQSERRTKGYQDPYPGSGKSGRSRASRKGR